jgi:pyrroloquinoline quinone biosynthesis protein D
MSDAQAKRTIIGAASRPALPRHVKMRHDAARDRWTILAPERVFTPDAIAVAVLQLCDGSRSVEAIAAELAQTYNAPKERILADVTALLQELADKGVVAA